jgi:hypothetical protein
MYKPPFNYELHRTTCKIRFSTISTPTNTTFRLRLFQLKSINQTRIESVTKMPSTTSNDPKASGSYTPSILRQSFPNIDIILSILRIYTGVESKAPTTLNTDSGTIIDPFASQLNDGTATLNSSVKASPAAGSPVDRRLSADEWGMYFTPLLQATSNLSLFLAWDLQASLSTHDSLQLQLTTIQMRARLHPPNSRSAKALSTLLLVLETATSTNTRSVTRSSIILRTK